MKNERTAAITTNKTAHTVEESKSKEVDKENKWKMQQFNNERPLERHTQSNWSHFMLIVNRFMINSFYFSSSSSRPLDSMIWYYAVMQQILRRLCWYCVMHGCSVVGRVWCLRCDRWKKNRKGVVTLCAACISYDDIDEIYNGER